LVNTMDRDLFPPKEKTDQESERKRRTGKAARVRRAGAARSNR
jgi:hypothetical protein